jgi:hypothetical protein
MANSQYYFHRQNWNIDTNPPGYPINTFSALAISAVMGLLFVIFLPVIGFVLVGKFLAQKAVEFAKPLFQSSIAPSPIPGEAHLTGTPGTSSEKSASEELDKFIEEVQALRAKK